MNWIGLTLIGAPLNAVTNLGYKVLAKPDEIYLFTSAIFIVTATCVFVYGRWRLGRWPNYLLAESMPLVVLGTGVLFMLTMIFFLTAFTHGGPISLVDPLLACSYAAVSIAFGVVLLRERPSLTAIAGIILYFIGATLMACG